MLGSQLGVGAYRALVEEGLNGVMVSSPGNCNCASSRSTKLIDPASLVTVVRYIDPAAISTGWRGFWKRT